MHWSARSSIKSLLALALVLPAGAHAAKAMLSRDCKVWDRPAGAERKPVTELKAGTEVRLLKRARDNFFKIQSNTAAGYILKSCLTTRKPSSLLYSSFSGDSFHVGLIGSLDGNMGRASASGDGSSELGYGVGLFGLLPVTRKFRINLSSYFRQISLSRAISISSQVNDPSMVIYSQTLRFAGIQVLGQYNVVRNFGVRVPLELWIDAGAEFLYPVGAEQTDSTGGTTTFTATDKPLLGIVGASAFYSLEHGIGIMAYLHAFYNVSATAGNSLLGGRFGASISIAI